jgi:hypothetical protein
MELLKQNETFCFFVILNHRFKNTFSINFDVHSIPYAFTFSFLLLITHSIIAFAKFSKHISSVISNTS